MSTFAATRPVAIVPDGTAFGRYIQAKMYAEQSDRSSALDFAAQWRDQPHIGECLREEFFSTKASVNPGTMAEPAWAAPLAQYGISREPLTIARRFAYGALRSRMRRAPFRVSVPREVVGASGEWVGEAAPAPVTAAQLDSLQTQLHKFQTIAIISQELSKVGTPDAQQSITGIVGRSIGAALDRQFLDPTITATAARPAAITNNAIAITSTGGTAVQIVADLTSMLGALTSSGDALTWIMPPTTAYRIAARLAGVGFATDVPRSLLGVPIVLSTGSPQQITLLDAGEIVFSDDDNLVVDVTRQASVELDTVPTSPVTSGTVLMNLWSLNLAGIKTTFWGTYQRVRSGSVVYMAVSY